MKNLLGVGAGVGMFKVSGVGTLKMFGVGVDDKVNRLHSPGINYACKICL